VQSSRPFYLKFVESLEKCGFTGILVDPCLWVNQYNKEVVVMEIYVDDCQTIGSKEGIKGVIKHLKKHDFGLIEEGLKHYLSYHIKIDKPLPNITLVPRD
jgi:hypothetical protein